MQSALTFLLLLSCLASTFAQSVSTLRAKALKAGDSVMFVSPARRADRDKVLLAKERLEQMGLKVMIHRDLFESEGYLAGTDGQRAGQLMDAFTNKNVAAVLPVTGGFGSTRLLDRLDYGLIRDNPKILLGYSDITGLHLAINKKTGLVTFHGPNLDSGLGVAKNLTDFSRHWFEQAVMRPQGGEKLGGGYTISWLLPNTKADRYVTTCELPRPTAMRSGKARGILIGGNLTLIATLMGTPFEIETADRILFLEDIGEAPYRIDRMLSTLRLAGKLDRLAAVVLGTFTYRDDQDTSITEGKSVEEVLTSYFRDLGVPVLRTFPAGHHPCNATLPIGAECELDADAGTLRVLKEPVLR